MKAIVLAAGQGTRLLPLTLDRPKCMVLFNGKALLDRLLETLKAASVADVVVVSGYKSDHIRRTGAKTVKNERFATTNMVATLFSAENEFPTDQDLLISYSDIIYEARVIEALRACDAPVSVPVNTSWRQLWEKRFQDPLSDAESLRIGEGGRLLEIGRKAKTLEEIEAQYMRLVKVRADYVGKFREHYTKMSRTERYDGKDFDNMYMTSFIQNLIDNKWDVRVVPVDGGWLEIDSVEDLEVYESWARDGSLLQFIRL